jgi:myo-inositol-1(or 4)-monophosphatase
VAAALVLLTEAGAAVSPFLEGDGPTTGNPILACAPSVAGALSTLTGLAAR